MDMAAESRELDKQYAQMRVEKAVRDHYGLTFNQTYDLLVKAGFMTQDEKNAAVRDALEGIDEDMRVNAQ